MRLPVAYPCLSFLQEPHLFPQSHAYGTSADLSVGDLLSAYVLETMAGPTLPSVLASSCASIVSPFFLTLLRFGAVAGK